VVSDGAQAWDAYRSERPDVVISDWVMPGLTGPQLCRNIRAQPAGEYAYFIMISEHSSPDRIREGMSAGADDYLVKPLDPDELQVRLIAAARVTSLHSQLAQQRSELEVVNHELREVVRRDPLTGLGNRRALQEDLLPLEARVRRYGHHYCIAMLDVDFFKSYNDTYGHQAGAEQLMEQARRGDAIYRYGGEEFLCVLPDQSLATATQAVQRMRAGVERLAIPHVANPPGLLTLSAGLAMLDAGHLSSMATALEAADQALYRAKQLGRNRVEQTVTPLS
jgi:diguanylate cyclase (GGDEF)-like protein